jgi:hypothetical protein
MVAQRASRRRTCAAGSHPRTIDGLGVNRFLHRDGLPKKPSSDFSDGLYPKNLDGVGARSAQWLRSAQAVAELARPEAIRAQSTILG